MSRTLREMFAGWSPATIAAHNAAVAAGRGQPPVAPQAQAEARAQPKVLLPEDRLNTTERRFLALLRARGYDPKPHAITLRLAYRCKYTPDFYTLRDGVQTLWEVKGAHIWEDSTIKIKTAAAMFREFVFIRAQWKDGKWTETAIHP